MPSEGQEAQLIEAIDELSDDNEIDEFGSYDSLYEGTRAALLLSIDGTVRFPVKSETFVYNLYRNLYSCTVSTSTMQVFTINSLTHLPRHGAFEKRASPVALEAYKLASDPRAMGKKTVNA